MRVTRVRCMDGKWNLCKSVSKINRPAKNDPRTGQQKNWRTSCFKQIATCPSQLQVPKLQKAAGIQDWQLSILLEVSVLSRPSILGMVAVNFPTQEPQPSRSWYISRSNLSLKPSANCVAGGRENFNIFFYEYLMSQDVEATMRERAIAFRRPGVTCLLYTSWLREIDVRIAIPGVSEFLPSTLWALSMWISPNATLNGTNAFSYFESCVALQSQFFRTGYVCHWHWIFRRPDVSWADCRSEKCNEGSSRKCRHVQSGWKRLTDGLNSIETAWCVAPTKHLEIYTSLCF